MKFITIFSIALKYIIVQVETKLYLSFVAFRGKSLNVLNDEFTLVIF